jgi:hypothetical protein
METVWNTFGKKKPHSNHESIQESFEQHLERMKIFRKSHNLAKPGECSRTLGTPHTKIEPVAPEVRKLLITLLIIGYVLNLIHERGTVVLPQNWQN